MVPFPILLFFSPSFFHLSDPSLLSSSSFRLPFRDFFFFFPLFAVCSLVRGMSWQFFIYYFLLGTWVRVFPRGPVLMTSLSNNHHLLTARSSPLLSPKLGVLKATDFSQTDPRFSSIKKAPMLSLYARKALLNRIANVPAKDLIILEPPMLYSANVIGVNLGTKSLLFSIFCHMTELLFGGIISLLFLIFVIFCFFCDFPKELCLNGELSFCLQEPHAPNELGSTARVEAFWLDLCPSKIFILIIQFHASDVV